MKIIPLFSGSSGNCSVVEAGDARLLIDAGCTGKAIDAALFEFSIAPDTIDAILVTHEHIDHIKGVGIMSRRYDIPVYANAGTWEGMRNIIGTVSMRNRRVFETDRDFYIKSVNVNPFKTPHDSIESVGYVFSRGGEKISIMTDIGHVSPKMLDAVEYSDIILIESNHDVDMLRAGSYPYPLKQRILGARGHLCNDDCGEVLSKLYVRGVNRAILGHLSRDNNTEEVALTSVRCKLRENQIFDESFELHVAHRDRACGSFTVGDAEELKAATGSFTVGNAKKLKAASGTFAVGDAEELKAASGSFTVGDAK